MVHATDLSAAFMFVSAGISLLLLTVALRAYRLEREPSLAYVAGAFLLFFAKSMLVGYSLLTGFIEHEVLELVDAIGDLGTISLLVAPLWLGRPRA